MWPDAAVVEKTQTLNINLPVVYSSVLSYASVAAMKEIRCRKITLQRGWGHLVGAMCCPHTDTNLTHVRNKQSNQVLPITLVVVCHTKYLV